MGQPSLQCSENGLVLIQKAIIEKGWPRYKEIWPQEASKFIIPELNEPTQSHGYVSVSTWKRFISGKPVKVINFKAFCKVLGLKWEEIVDWSCLPNFYKVNPLLVDEFEYEDAKIACNKKALNSYAKSILNTKYSVEPSSDIKRESIFITGKPINDPRRFFGRHKQVKQVFMELETGYPISNISIQGPKRSGKTSLLKFIYNAGKFNDKKLRPNHSYINNARCSNFKWIYIDFRDPLMRSMEKLLEKIIKDLDFTPPKSYDLYNFLCVMKNNLRDPTIILLDDISIAFQRCPEFDDQFWDGLRYLSCNFDLAYIFTSSENPKLVAQNNNCTSAFFNIFTCVPTLGPFLNSDAHELISSSPIQFDNDDSEWIFKETNCWPHLLQIYSKYYLNHLKSSFKWDWKDEAKREINNLNL